MPFVTQRPPPAILANSKAWGEWVEDPNYPNTYHNWLMLENQLETTLVYTPNIYRAGIRAGISDAFYDAD